VPEVLVDTASEWSPEDFPTPEIDTADWNPAFDAVAVEPFEETDSVAVARAEDLSPGPGFEPDGTLAVHEPAAGYESVEQPGSSEQVAATAPNESGRSVAAPVEPAAETKVTFVFQESEDQAGDLDRLRRLHAALSRWQGEDPFMITFDGARGRRQLVGDELRISFCPQLQSEVEEILGQGCVRLTP